MAFPVDHLLASIFGILGNIISFGVFLAPICIKTENRMMIIVINSVGFAVETTYIDVFLIYANKEVVIYTTKILVTFNIIFFGLLAFTTLYGVDGRSNRVNIVGWICAIVSVCGFATPLSIMRLVIRTKSVEYMPFSLSFFLTLCAIMWFFYGLMIKDYYIAAPNVLGFVFGIAQLALYMRYKDNKKQLEQVIEPRDELPQTVVDLGVISSTREPAEVKLQAITEIQELPRGEDEIAGAEAGMGSRE